MSTGGAEIKPLILNRRKVTIKLQHHEYLIVLKCLPFIILLYVRFFNLTIRMLLFEVLNSFCSSLVMSAFFFFFQNQSQEYFINPGGKFCVAVAYHAKTAFGKKNIGQYNKLHKLIK